MSNVCVSDTPFAPLGLAIDGINAYYTPFAPLVLIRDLPKPRRGERCIGNVNPVRKQAPEGRKVSGLKSVLETRGDFLKLTHKGRTKRNPTNSRKPSV
ncbi:MAG: hypothetical protein OXM61_03170 [Candidatus Poribacteria bacterium]|nr:hypothetical protein [Candidatus Poribacteria bacterium]